ncbi:hypothetical protein LB559_09455 [Mesorhizobium sp. BR1-1-3]|uniref:hypothetical protein n=1 Tax=Mesorhizobium sp. BR1-1-3 TaxID=2876651 RepID=UPI001CD053DB|nr:hypothetical protein [Mesorhizobium sp. BR1-1-3]MBZ9888165.1 hypothetical protein [Mesorhizobium sp. BR1-1-3]
MSEVTSGPWIVEDIQVDGAHKQISAFGEDGNRILCIRLQSFNPDEDAGLVAAAPIMLAALKAIATPLEAVLDDQASQGIQFGRTHAERAERQRVLADWIRANADKVDDALELIFGAIAASEMRTAA